MYTLNITYTWMTQGWVEPLLPAILQLVLVKQASLHRFPITSVTHIHTCYFTFLNTLMGFVHNYSKAHIFNRISSAKDQNPPVQNLLEKHHFHPVILQSISWHKTRRSLDQIYIRLTPQILQKHSCENLLHLK